MSTAKLKNDRTQLIDHWSGMLKQHNWHGNLTGRCQSIQAAITNNTGEADSLIRVLHDEFGYKAKTGKGGHCVGAIFRTEKFISIAPKNRIGRGRALGMQNIHIEHTIPVKELEIQLEKKQFARSANLLKWLVKHSVVTAMSYCEKHGLPAGTYALDSGSPEFNKPFERYSGSDIIVWNVFDQKQVNLSTLTFDEHADIIKRLLKSIGLRRQEIVKLIR